MGSTEDRKKSKKDKIIRTTKRCIVCYALAIGLFTVFEAAVLFLPIAQHSVWAPWLGGYLAIILSLFIVNWLES